MFVRKDSLGELSDTRRGLLAQEDMLRFRLKFSQGLTNASDEHVLTPINMKFYSVDFEPLGILVMQTGNLWTPYNGTKLSP